MEVKKTDLARHHTYEELKSFGKQFFSENPLGEGPYTPADSDSVKKFLGEATHRANPNVRASYWEHILIAPELGKRVAEKLKDKGLKIDPYEIEIALLLHDDGREVDTGFLINDFIGARLNKEIGIPKRIIDDMTSLQRFLEVAGKLELEESQLDLQTPLSKDQEEILQQYFDSLTVNQRITNLADNLGKRDSDGIFTLDGLKNYLKTYETRNEQPGQERNIDTFIARTRRSAAAFQYYVVSKTVEWLGQKGVDVPDILRSLVDYGPKFVLVVRHGELSNPQNIVYNRDSVMSTDSIIHLSSTGEEQLRKVGEILKKYEFKLSQIAVSPETRARESAVALNRVLELPRDKIQVDTNLDDTLAPGPFIAKLTMDQWEELKGDAYDTGRWGQYNHETAESVTRRMIASFWTMSQRLKTGEVGLLISHGDPIAWLLNSLHGSTPQPKELRNALYPGKGTLTVAIIDPQGNLFSTYLSKESAAHSAIY